MQKRIEINKFRKLDNRLELEGINPALDTGTLRATGEMLVDSDSLAFIYKLENEQEFIYVSLPSEIWPFLKEVIETEQQVNLILDDTNIELTNIIPEIKYLLHNIEGNANYGDDMVHKVEEIFL
ncbi:hypothetical protein [Fredinandcohnia sp. 179-A 10B2 NHS]|uniref:UPF0738 family protein n=1 Tax=Fredinandcohnia sp. 179-A 10B2 NHS TaxID=3235176 RepID=UPI0039A18A44